MTRQRILVTGGAGFLGSHRCERLLAGGHEVVALEVAERTRDVKVRIARIFNTYGPRMTPDDGRVVSDFIVQALADEDLTVYGDGTQTRSFCYVDDVVEGLVRLMEHPFELGPVNLGNPEEYPVRRLAETVARLASSRSRIVYHPLPEDDPKRRRPDIGRARSVLGFTPKTPLEEGLRHTIRYFRSLGIGRAPPAAGVGRAARQTGLPEGAANGEVGR